MVTIFTTYSQKAIFQTTAIVPYRITTELSVTGPIEKKGPSNKPEYFFELVSRIKWTP
jgi:hypothetical protein